MNQALQKNHFNKATTAVSNISNLSMSGDYTLTFIQGEEGERGGGDEPEPLLKTQPSPPLV